MILYSINSDRLRREGKGPGEILFRPSSKGPDVLSITWAFQVRTLIICYAMLCYAMLCYAMLCYAMLCYAMLCYAMLFSALLYSALLLLCSCSTLLCFVVPCPALVISTKDFFLHFLTIMCYFTYTSIPLFHSVNYFPFLSSIFATSSPTVYFPSFPVEKRVPIIVVIITSYSLSSF